MAEIPRCSQLETIRVMSNILISNYLILFGKYHDVGSGARNQYLIVFKVSRIELIHYSQVHHIEFKNETFLLENSVNFELVSIHHSPATGIVGWEDGRNFT